MRGSRAIRASGGSAQTPQDVAQGAPQQGAPPVRTAIARMRT